MEHRPFLLSTAATLREYGILDYDGFDFSIGRLSRRKYTVDSMKRLVKKYLYSVIVPNILILKDYLNFGDRKVRNMLYRETLKALGYAMRQGRNRPDRDDFRNMTKSEHTGWMFEKIYKPLNYYAFDLSFNKKERRWASEIKPGKDRITLHRYVEEHMDKRKLKKFGHTGTPALNELINAYARDRKVADYTIAQFKERFGCSTYTIAKFKAYLREREGKGKVASFLVNERPHGRKKHGAETAAIKGTA